MKVQFDKTQVWSSRLQNLANATKIGSICYWTAIFDMKPIISRVSETIYEETKKMIEINLTMEAAFKDKDTKKR
eukprot:7730796-Ditylum_brightwellii.AAC.1